MKSIRSAEEKVMGEMLREWRDKAGLTQAEVADKAGVDRLVITRIEIGDQIPDALLARRIGRALGKSPKQLWWHLEFRLERLAK